VKNRTGKRKYAVIAAVVAFLAVICAVCMRLSSAKPGEDPHWRDWHIMTGSTDEAIRLFGDNLLLARYGDISDGCDSITYSLELVDDGSTIENRDKWVMLDATSFGKGCLFSMHIYFDPLDSRIDDARSVIMGNDVMQADAIFINGTQVDYALEENRSKPGAANSLLTMFEYNGNVYCFDYDVSSTVHKTENLDEAQHCIDAAWSALYHLLGEESA